MNSTYRVSNTAGSLLGIFPTSEIAAVKALVDANPGAVVKSVTTIDNPCSEHPAYEAANCPTCGTSRMSS